MNLYLRTPGYTEQLAAFLTSVGQRPVVPAPGRVQLGDGSDEVARLEIEIYLRVWRVLHPEAEVELTA